VSDDKETKTTDETKPTSTDLKTKESLKRPQESDESSNTIAKREKIEEVRFGSISNIV